MDEILFLICSCPRLGPPAFSLITNAEHYINPRRMRMPYDPSRLGGNHNINADEELMKTFHYVFV